MKKTLSFILKGISLILVFACAFTCLASCVANTTGSAQNGTDGGAENATPLSKDLIGAELSDEEENTKALIEMRIEKFFEAVRSNDIDKYIDCFNKSQRTTMKSLLVMSGVSMIISGVPVPVGDFLTKKIFGFAISVEDCDNWGYESINLCGNKADVLLKKVDNEDFSYTNYEMVFEENGWYISTVTQVPKIDLLAKELLNANLTAEEGEAKTLIENRIEEFYTSIKEADVDKYGDCMSRGKRIVLKGLMIGLPLIINGFIASATGGIPIPVGSYFTDAIFDISVSLEDCDNWTIRSIMMYEDQAKVTVRTDKGEETFEYVTYTVVLQDGDWFISEVQKIGNNLKTEETQ